MNSSNKRLYVIGDIHGRLDLLQRMCGLVNADIGSRDQDSLVVTLGDYIDRGPDSRGVIDYLLSGPFAGQFVGLKGNHEALLEKFLSDPAIGTDWWRLGGLQTLKSFGITVGPRMTKRGFKKAAVQLRETLTQQQLEFFSSLKTSFVVGSYFLCHAGVRPGVALDLQNDDDLLWIRNEFLESKIDFGKIVIHGHTPTREPQVLANRINIDTGAFDTGRLTCIVLEESKHRFIST